ncbi:MAG TPA: Ig-like domain-containing protein [Gemmatimonadales bacterium]|nr:Ig-like domain-containing protein [Gemmatimonadales bacterium]
MTGTTPTVSESPLDFRPRRALAIARRACRAAVWLAPLAPLPVASARAQTVAEVQVTPETMTLEVGQKQTVFAAAFDRQGNLIPNARFTFRSSDTTVARVEREGVVVGLGPGLARVEARTQSRRGSVAVLVTGPGGAPAVAGIPGRAPGAALTLEPAALRLLPGESARLMPQAVRDDGALVEPGPVAWKSLRPDVAGVDGSGTVVGVAPGRSIVQAAAANGLMATAPVEVESAAVVLSKSRVVLPPNGVDTLTLLVPSQGGRAPLSGAEWRSTDTTVARVGPTGIVQGLRPGTTEIVVTGFHQELRTQVVVHRAPRALILTPRVTGGAIQLPLSQTRKFSAVAEAEDSTPIPEVRIQWEVGDTALASFDTSSGELTPRALGTTSLTARLAGFPPASWALTIVPGRLRIDRARIGLPPGGRASLSGVLLDERDSVVGPAAQLVWTSNRPEVATIDAGTITALRVGRATISATTPWGVAAQTEVFVTGDFLVASNRTGTLGIWQARLGAPDSLLPVLVDSAANSQPVFSPERTRIAFSSNRAALDANYDVYVMNADGTDVRRLTTARGNDGEPVWTPDGRHLVFSSTRDGAPQLYVVPADSGEARPLTAATGGNQSPAVAPDGRTVAFVSLRDGGPRIYRIGLDGQGEARVTTGALREGTPRFFPDGDLAYGVERSNNARQWRVMRASAGGPAVPLFETDQPLVWLSIAADGAHALYVTASSNRPEPRTFLRALEPGGKEVPFRRRSGEQIPSASF